MRSGSFWIFFYNQNGNTITFVDEMQKIYHHSITDENQFDDGNVDGFLLLVIIPKDHAGMVWFCWKEDPIRRPAFVALERH